MDKYHQLAWQIAMGADEALEDAPINRLLALVPEPEEPEAPAASIAPVKQPEPVAPQPARMTVATPYTEALQQAKTLADNAGSLEELRIAVTSFKALGICKTATNTVFADGVPTAEIMFIGEAPGANEDAEGIPFCGQAGQLMDEMVKWINLSRKKNIYISNTLFWRPPGNRRPTQEEIDVCRPFVEKHIALINPKLLVLWGGTATSALLGSSQGITKLRGNYHSYTNSYLSHSIPTAAIFHPSYLLRQPAKKREAWQDLLSLQNHIGKEKINI